ncbi:hypothetical protein DFR30_2362 [Thiogranum longum]|uniref:N-acetyltransferase domain-containing protein n=1 Tax=Thiogranum longum TaxID=1537524 RepID=A0A4R1HCA4_9GAMM|nr:N-acetyltransferase [Thiogranum longum]TCK19068.1 hypothetical protein DFR30_2362 [Thiogranum longum]
MQADKDDLDVRCVDNKARLKDFIQLPWSVYRNDPHWVAPLLIEQKQRYSRKNPFFDHARWRGWVAYRNNSPVGRISAQIDQLFLDRYKDPVGYFGSLEAEDDPAVFSALFQAAEAWLANEGMSHVTGPFTLSINEEAGLLVDGFDTPPCIMMGHNPPYYGAHVEANGYTPARDLLAYHQPPTYQFTPTVKRLLERLSGRIRLRQLNRKKLDEELAILRHIFNDAWSENWGFVPFTEAEFREVGKAMTLLLDDDFVQIAEVDGEPAAMIIGLPDINQAIKDLNGRLLPLGWLKLLWRIKVRYPDRARIPLMGVLKKYQHTRLGPALAFAVTEALRTPFIRRGIKEVEMSWILENNQAMRNIIEKLGGVEYKRYRLYEKNLHD